VNTSQLRRERIKVLHSCEDYATVGVLCACEETVVVLCRDCGEALSVIAAIPACTHAVAVMQRGRL